MTNMKNKICLAFHKLTILIYAIATNHEFKQQPSKLRSMPKAVGAGSHHTAINGCTSVAHSKFEYKQCQISVHIVACSLLQSNHEFPTSSMEVSNMLHNMQTAQFTWQRCFACFGTAFVVRCVIPGTKH